MQYKFIKHSRIWFILSILVIVVGIGSMINNKINQGTILSYGIDFTGGSLMEIQFDDEAFNPEIETLYSTINSVFPDKVSQITITDENSYLVQSKTMSEEERQEVHAAVTENMGEFEEVKFQSIGPKIGETLKRKAVIALTIALITIVLYIAYAFRNVPKKVSQWKFGFAAILALAHDVLITLGVFALLGLEVNAFFIIALLTIMGFSVHDTIVVFDRIRENLQRQSRDDTFGDVADVSLNQTLSRSINTSVSTLFPLLALYIWGAPAIQTFVFALIVGIFVGTYSSIFIASPVLTLWQEKGRLR